MQAMQSLAAWHKEGRPADSNPGMMSDEERVRVMINASFSAAKANLDKMRDDLE